MKNVTITRLASRMAIAISKTENKTMLINKLSKAVGFGTFFAGQAVSQVYRAIILMFALVVAPAIHADCLPSVPAGWQVPVYISTHNAATHAVGYAIGSLTASEYFYWHPSVLSGNGFPQVFSDRWAPCNDAGSLGCQKEIPESQDFDVAQADQLGVSIRETVEVFGHPPVISVTLTLQTWGNATYTFAATCDSTTNLLYGSFDNNTMAVFSFGQAQAPEQPPQ